MRKVMQTVRGLLGSRRGITGLETAIVLIAFVVVSSTFAFAALSTGLFSADKSKETINAGLREATGTMQLVGHVYMKEGSANVVDEIYFQVSNAAGSGEINMTVGTLIAKYTDKNQSKFYSAAPLSVVSVSGDGDNLLEPNEIMEVRFTGMEADLSTDLGVNTIFTIELIPPEGASVIIERTTPSTAFDAYEDLN